jgi:carboxyl-terminal processing protease
MRRKYLWVLAPLTLIPFLAGVGFRHHDAVDGQLLFEEVRARVARGAVDSLSDDKIFENAARGLVDHINDPYAELYSPEELASFSRNTLRNDYAGVGMQIQDQLGNIVVAAVFPNSPAAKGGVLVGDRILFVDTSAVTGLKIDQVSGKLLGKAGTPVTVTFARPGQEAQIQRRFSRAVVHVPAVPYALMLDNGVGYVPLQRFNEASAADVMAAVNRLRSAGARSFVLDLRGNPGGSVEESVSISNLFLKPGQEIVSVRYRERDPEVRRAENDGEHVAEPMIVMVDGGAASASEIVAGALQDHDRALVVGTTSFGKGVMQSIYPLHQGWALKLTTAKWYTPSGRSIQRERVMRNGELVAVRPDSLETDSARRSRPDRQRHGGVSAPGRRAEHFAAPDHDGRAGGAVPGAAAGGGDPPGDEGGPLHPAGPGQDGRAVRGRQHLLDGRGAAEADAGHPGVRGRGARAAIGPARGGDHHRHRAGERGVPGRGDGG